MKSLAIITTVVTMLALPAVASTFDFTTIVNSAQEVPTPVDRGAIGEATITVDTDAENFDFQFNVVGLNLDDLGGLPQTVLDTAGPVHLHVGAPGETGGIIVAFGPSTGSGFSDAFPFSGAALGSVPGFSLEANDVGFDTVAEFDTFFGLLSTGNIYLNVHTALNPSGEVRGDFAGVTPVPLPASALLLLAGIGGLASMRRTRT